MRAVRVAARGAGAVAAIAVALASGAASAQTRVERTVHNLSPSGPGAFRAPEPAGVCVFCHTPHNANPTRALWNRDLPGTTYRIYESSTLAARPGQPTGASRLCLSCHDGTLALGAVRVGGPYALGPLTGESVVGTDLSDDHPVSFTYDAALAARNGELADPTALPATVRLDDTQQVQCSSCHNPHEDRNPKFLRADNRFSALCTSCHRRRDWPTSSHASSSALLSPASPGRWPHAAYGGYTTVADQGCESCHRSHAAGSPARLVIHAREEDTCTACHDGTVAALDVAGEFRKPSAHPVGVAQDVHDPAEDPLTMARHVECQDCHNPHAVTNVPAGAPLVSGRLRRVKGVTQAGTPVAEASFQYEVCYACHGLEEQPSPVVQRADPVYNVRLELDSVNASFHPVTASGRSVDVPSLKPPWTTASLMYCTDCHGSDTPATNGQGPHGSGLPPILSRSHPLTGSGAESAATYDLCYSCHDRTSILSDASFPEHRRHVVDEQTPCAVCHDAHGSRESPRLVNFLLRDRFGTPVVQPNGSGLLRYESLGPSRGRCYLLCHGEDHDPQTYP